MSSDGYFDDDNFDDAAFEQLDAIEAAHNRPRAPSPELDEFDSFGNIDASELERIDTFIEDSYQGKAQPVAGPSRTSSRGTTLQTTLYGGVLPPSPPKVPRAQVQRTNSVPRNPFGQQAPKTKKWDHTAFAKSGSRKKDKRKDDHEEGEEESVQFEQFPAPFVSIGCVQFSRMRVLTSNIESDVIQAGPPPMKLKPDLLETKHWIYPLNQPKRDYQFNIVKHCLFDNTIVALPTGLGKTFIAGVVMLNFYRWFPEGKVVFVAPTKPLVAQQIEASHKTCGIPGSDAIELTGHNVRAMRARAWKEKRVFYMTPQTLFNDLESENCDARDIILLVIDEAHRATGGYAYNDVVRFMMAKNPHFRILALTATPGGDPTKVQNLIDGLHISRIEIRDENSLDLKAYVFHKKVEQHVIAMSEESVLKPLQERGVMSAWADPVKLHSFSAQSTMATLKPDQRWAYGPLSKLMSLCRAMAYLIEGTIGMCNTYMRDLERDKETDDAEGGKKKTASKAKKFKEDPQFQAVIKELEAQRLRGFAMHPKMEKLKALVVEHFAQKLGDDGQETEQTRVMVFSTFREAVDEIVDALNTQKPLIRANRFIGQGTDKQGRKGLAQKEQLELIKKFKAGEYNVLVATSIGEEGLDIGEVDLIVCYDAQKTPIRMLQRLGRTGRKRDGFVHVLLSEGREELNMDKAKATYKEVQKSIVRGDQLELYGDVGRLLPDHIKPECLEQVMDIQEYVREDGRKKRSGSKERGAPKGTKRKRNDDVFRNIPDGASTGFVSVAELLVKGSSKKQKVARSFEEAGQDDETDEELESGSILVPPRRAASSSSAPAKPKSKLRRAATEGNKRIKKSNVIAPTPSQFKLKAIDDEDDMDIERGTLLSPARPSSSGQSRSKSPTTIEIDSDSDSPPRILFFVRHIPSIDWPVDYSLSFRQSRSRSPTAIEIDSDSDSPARKFYPLVRNIPFFDSPAEPSPSAHNTPPGKDNISWLVEDDDDGPDFEIVDSSPEVKKRQSPAPSEGSACVVDGPMSSKAAGKRRAITPIHFEPDESVEIVESLPPRQPAAQDPDDSVELVTDTSPIPKPTLRAVRRPGTQKPDMPPPPLPSRFLVSNSPPEPSFPVRAPGRVARASKLFDDSEPESPAMDIPPPSQRRRLRRRESSPIQENHRPRSPKHKASSRMHKIYDMEAVHSGDEVSEGSSGSEEVESESDRQFLQELPETQMSPSYNQSLVYRQSLLTQAPGGGRVPTFGNRPVRKGMFGGGLSESSRRRPQVSSSPPRDPDEEDAYDIGSFVVDDDAEISFLSSES
ncbi:ATP-dependent DNA helicase mph1 [Mycena venus]|uniref:ATP-dependent DNA helicase n=1 Tax=Mycena venus TaxID=2733690 RepID=A0A8H6XG36_9AGAR|nr:ATP-dependent DNA helicase mph1 [Mycena venus]